MFSWSCASYLVGGEGGEDVDGGVRRHAREDKGAVEVLLRERESGRERERERERKRESERARESERETETETGTDLDRETEREK